MTRLVVVEARRLLPIVILFLMLVAVSVYDGFSTNTAPVTTGPNSVPYKTLTQAAQAGEKQMQIVTDLNMWVTMHNALGISLTDYDFDPQREVAVFLLNCQLRSTTEEDGIVGLEVISRKNSYQLVLFDKSHLPEGEVNFVLQENQ